MSGAILTCDEVRECERRAAASGTSLSTLMQRAGEAVAAAVQRRFPLGRVVVLAGPGNNGGDAFVAALRLKAMGREVVLHELAPGGPRTEEGAQASALWARDRSSLAQLALTPSDIVLDGLFGAGLSRPLQGEAARAVELVNASGAKTVAIDVPSGVGGDSGKADGPAIRAALTVTFGAKKPAHVLDPASRLCGEIEVAAIGFEDHIADVSQGRLRESDPGLWAHLIGWPQPGGHKYKRGRLIVVSGPVQSTGAARLTARAGQRLAGACRILCPPGALEVVAASMMSPLTASFTGADDLAKQAEDGDAVVIGPAAGVDDATRANVEALAATGLPLVLDADALTVFKGEAAALSAILKGPAVLTPHTGEFGRLFPGLIDASPSKIEAARTAAASVGAVVLLKGSDTVIATPDGQAVVNIHATPFLATAGSGDTLAGIIGGLMAQGMAAFPAACAGAWLHGDAGIRAGPGLIAEDLDQSLREALAELYRRHPLVT